MVPSCGTIHENIFEEDMEDPEGTESAWTKESSNYSKKTGCASCSSKKGKLKMFPDPHGVRLMERKATVDLFRMLRMWIPNMLVESNPQTKK